MEVFWETETTGKSHDFKHTLTSPQLLDNLSANTWNSSPKQTYQSSLRFIIPPVLHHTVADRHSAGWFLVSSSRYSLESSSTRVPKTKGKIFLHHTPLCWSWCLYTYILVFIIYFYIKFYILSHNILFYIIL